MRTNNFEEAMKKLYEGFHMTKFYKNFFIEKMGEFDKLMYHHLADLEDNKTDKLYERLTTMRKGKNCIPEFKETNLRVRNAMMKRIIEIK
jgi:hypothetical protein